MIYCHWQMPSSNVWIGSRVGLNPWSTLESPFARGANFAFHQARKRLRDQRNADRASDLEDVGQQYKRARTVAPTKRGMPARTPYRRLPKRATRKRYPRRYKPARISRRIPTLWPATQLVKFKVASRGSMSGAAGVIDTEIIKANSLNDPLSAIGANELPLGLDQYATMYSKYCIVASRMIFDCHAMTATGGIIVGACVAKDASTLSESAHYRERPGTVVRYLTSDADKTRLVLSYRGKRFEKIKNWRMSENYHAAFDADPSDPTTVRYYQIFLQDLYSGGGETATIDYMVQVEYVCLLFEPIIPTRSTY